MIPIISLILAAVMLVLTACAVDKPKDGNNDVEQTGDVTGTEGTVSTGESGGEPQTGDDDKPYDEPDIPDDTLLHSDLYEYDLTKYILPIPYDDLCIDSAYLESQIQEEINSFLSYYGELVEYEDADHKVIKGDTANIFFTGKAHFPEQVISDTTLSSMTNVGGEEGTDLEIGSNSFIGAYTSDTEPEKNNPGFEDQIIGHKKGESFTITVTFPDEYRSEELRGQIIDFDITINYIKHLDTSELTDELVREYTDFESAEQFRKDVRDYYIKDDVYNGILDSVTVSEFPDSSVNVEDIVTEFLFKDLGLSITQGKFEEMVNEHYAVYAMQYYYYYGITSCEQFVESIGKQNLILFFERDLVKDKLAEVVTVV